ncbi:unnamed protein product [Anisakis simplex]|uniref:Ig-like domain-containing protein n=1 Tax=Anisakis simplex TaxID=6269 RepID=A0A0M3JA45_ANISI|nr:unnamed protein product [Anisakis simplex]
MKTVESDSGAYICSTGHPDDYDTESVDSAPVHLTVTSSKPSGPLLVSEEETVNEGDYARLRCYSPGVDDSELHWRREDGREMSEGTTDEHGILTIAQASPSDAGVYLCSMRDPSGYEVDSLPARITVNSVARMSSHP